MMVLFLYVVVSNLLLALEWCAQMLWIIHMLDVISACTFKQLSAIYKGWHATKQEDRFHCQFP